MGEGGAAAILFSIDLYKYVFTVNAVNVVLFSVKVIALVSPFNFFMGSLIVCLLINSLFSKQIRIVQTEIQLHNIVVQDQ